MIDFLYTFLNFLQPGAAWPELAPFKPMLIVAVVAGLSAFSARGRDFPLASAYRQRTFVWLCAFIVFQALSLHAGGVGEMIKGFGYWYVFLLFVAISIARLKNEAALRRYVWGLMVGTMVIVFFGIYAVFAKLPNAIGGRAGAYGMYENHNDYSFAIIMVLPFLFKIRTQEKKVLRRLFLGICLLACVLGIFLSLSRGGVVAMILELVMLILGTWKGWKRVVLVSGMIMFGVAAIGYQWAKRAENQGSNYTAEDAESSRMELWKAGGNMVKAHPFLGVGSLSFGEHARDYGELSGDQIGKNSHNTYIEVVATSGILGFVAFLMMLRGMIKTLRQKLTRPGHEWLEAARSATLISLWSIMLRALLDAKPHDWSFYVLCSIAISYGALRAAIEKSEAGAGDPVAEAPRPRFVAGGRFVRPGFTR